MFIPKSSRRSDAFTFLSKPCGPQKIPYDIPLYWLVNRDPHNGLL